jgi:hypothetical protein
LHLGGLGDEAASVVAFDRDDGLWVAGTFTAGLAVDGEPVASDATAGIFVIHCHPDEGVTWVQTFGAESAVALDLATDPAGGATVVGRFFGWMEIDGDRSEARGEGDGYVISLDTDGAVRWSTIHAGTPVDCCPINFDTVGQVAYGDDGNLYLAGEFRGRTEVAGELLVSSGWDDVFVGSFTPLGEPRWATSFGGEGSDETTDLSLTREGDLLVSGGFQQTMIVGDSVLTSAGGSDGFVARLGANGVHVWARGFGDWDGDRIYGVAPSGEGNLFVGSFAREPMIGRFRVPSHATVVARLDEDGFVDWVNLLPPLRQTALLSRGTDGYLVSGWFSGSFDPDEAIVSAGDWDGFVLGLSNDGELLWIEQIGGVGRDRVNDLGQGTDGRIAIAGAMGASESIFGSPLVVSGESDGFVVVLH